MFPRDRVRVVVGAICGETRESGDWGEGDAEGPGAARDVGGRIYVRIRRYDMILIEGTTAPTVGGVTLRPVSTKRWRVLDRTGRILGHLRAEAVSAGIRFHAERFDITARRLRELGAFWSASEAVECLRYLR